VKSDVTISVMTRQIALEAVILNRGTFVVAGRLTNMTSNLRSSLIWLVVLSLGSAAVSSPPLQDSGATPLLWTTNLMAPALLLNPAVDRC
jgi:hypothetical protein